jgi:hypothetical protein
MNLITGVMNWQEMQLRIIIVKGALLIARASKDGLPWSAPLQKQHLFGYIFKY